MSEERLYRSPDEIQLNDEDEIRKILGHPPGWALRWGITAVCIAVALFLALAWWIQFPDIITARVSIVTAEPPVRLFARSDGLIGELYVEDRQYVPVGKRLAVLANAAILSDMDALASWFESATDAQSGNYRFYPPVPQGLLVGELQSSYTALIKAVAEHQQVLERDDVATKVNNLQERITYLRRLNQNLALQQATLDTIVRKNDREVLRTRLLQKSGARSQSDLEKATIDYLRARQLWEAIPADTLRNQLEWKGLEAQIVDLLQSRINDRSDKSLAVQRWFRQLKGEYELWRQKYLLEAPIEGRISFYRNWVEGHFVKMRDTLLTVLPALDSAGIVGEGRLPVDGAGRVRPGMVIHLRLDAYPHRKYGIVEGELQEMSLLAEQNSYRIKVALPDTLVTSYGEVIPFGQELSASARIITEERRILVRIFDVILDLYKNR